MKTEILVTTTLPSSTSEALKNDAVTIARKIVADLDYIGVMGVEFFLKKMNFMLTKLLQEYITLGIGQWMGATPASSSNTSEQLWTCLCYQPRGIPTL